ncbi:MAG: tetratricopeptide repeat protein, partial [Acidobacteriota bacterium]
TDQTPQWAADKVAQRFETQPPGLPHYGEALQAGRQGRPGAGRSLLELIVQASNPAIVRATALSLLPGNAPREAIPVIQSSLSDPDPLVRLAALQAARLFPPQARLQSAAPVLKDPVRLVRLEAASLLASLPAQMFSPDQRKARQAAIEEYLQAQMSNAERPESHLNRGALHQQMGQFAQAEAAYLAALKIDPRFAPVYVNLSDLYRQQDREQEGEEMLRLGLESLDEADLHHALGLVLVRQQRHSEALGELEKASRQRPEQPRYSYVYAVALHSSGQPQRAIAALENALQRHPYDQQLLLGLVSFHREGGSLQAAIRYARRLVEASGQNPQALQLLRQLESQ